MKKKIIIVVAAALVGFLYCAFNNQWVIIRVPSANNQIVNDAVSLLKNKKTVKRVFWHNEQWNEESTELLWSDNASENIHLLITSWLNLLEEENSALRKVSLQSVAISASGNQAYCSFDRSPFDKNQSTFLKILWIEGLMKTLYANDTKIQEVYFLTHHQPLNDYHLDFSYGWPVSGMLASV